MLPYKVTFTGFRDKMQMFLGRSFLSQPQWGYGEDDLKQREELESKHWKQKHTEGN